MQPCRCPKGALPPSRRRGALRAGPHRAAADPEPSALSLCRLGAPRRLAETHEKLVLLPLCLCNRALGLALPRLGAFRLSRKAPSERRRVVAVRPSHLVRLREAAAAGCVGRGRRPGSATSWPGLPRPLGELPRRLRGRLPDGGGPLPPRCDVRAGAEGESSHGFDPVGSVGAGPTAFPGAAAGGGSSPPTTAPARAGELPADDGSGPGGGAPPPTPWTPPRGPTTRPKPARLAERPSWGRAMAPTARTPAGVRRLRPRATAGATGSDPRAPASADQRPRGEGPQVGVGRGAPWPGAAPHRVDPDGPLRAVSSAAHSGFARRALEPPCRRSFSFTRR